TFSSIDRNGLILWKVDIPFDCENDKLKMLDNAFGTINIKEDLKGEKMLPGDEISKYLKNLPPSSIHIIVEPPSSATTGKCLPMVYLSNKKFALSHIFFFIRSGTDGGSLSIPMKRQAEPQVNNREPVAPFERDF